MATTTQLQRRSPVEHARAFLSALMTRSDKSILPFIPRPIKFLVLFIFLLNYRSWPFVWHLKVLKYYTRLHLDKLFLARTSPMKRKWIENISIVGANPFELVSTVKCYAGLDDISMDRLSETAVRKACDRGRAKVDSGLYPALFGEGIYTALGSSHCYFIRGIPHGTSYEVRTTIGGWDKKWMYLVHHFITFPNRRTKSQSLVVAPTTRKELMPSRNCNIPKYFTKTPLPEDAIVHCIAISTTVFKAGRITVPPAVAFISGGFGDPTKQRWPHVQNLRFSKRYQPASDKAIIKNRLRDIVVGGWKMDYVDGWDLNPETGVCTFWELEEYEKTRSENMQAIFEGIQYGLVNLKDRKY